MAVTSYSLLLWILFFFFLLSSMSNCAPQSSHEVFVVYMGAAPQRHESEVVSEHHHLLASVVGSIQGAQDAILYHYHRSFRGFAAKMSSHHAQALSELDGVHSVFKSRHHRPHTTHSWDFLGVVSSPAVSGCQLNCPSVGFGLPTAVTANSSAFPSFSNQSDVIIGFIDTGYWPESQSYSDLDMAPIPLRWKGACVPGDSFGPELCNKKVIGARYFYAAAQQAFSSNGTVLTDSLSARDIDGHGSHVSSTAAGREVANVGFGTTYIGNGTARGGATGARIAIYKACWTNDQQTNICAEADVLAAFDNAVADGVDILSVSLAGPSEGSVFTGGLAIGSFHAARRGILVAASAGNDGPDAATVGNTAPWIFTVAASTTDRQFVCNVQLGDGTIIPGRYVLNSYTFPAPVPIVLGFQAAAVTATSDQASSCVSFSLDPVLASGAILVCFYDPSSETEVMRVGGVGVIFIGMTGASNSFILPATFITYDSALLIRSYVVATPSPRGVILPTETVFDEKPAPLIAAFSSRGPSQRNPDILKPDITAPGVDILAAYSPLALGRETGVAANLSYSILSGTSMSCPHVAGIAALIKVAHPDWSPAAIRSAIMTTAYQVDNSGNETIQTLPLGAIGGYYDFGAGHVQPIRALDPGLVYDILPDDYINYLCSFDPSGAIVQGETATCPPVIIPAYNLNYPSITLSSLSGQATVVRTLTNVGPLGAVVYTAAIASPSGVQVTVVPPTLQFQSVGQQLSFDVVFQVQIPSNAVAFGTLQWSDGVHFVTSPIVVNPVAAAPPV